MFKRMSLRIQLTVLMTLLLIICTISITVFLNYSTYGITSAVTTEAQFSSGELAQTLTTTPVETAQQLFFLQSLLFLLVIIIIGGLSTYLLTKKLLKPLGTLQDKMIEIDVNNLSETIQLPQYNSETTHLAKAFNGMTQKLNDSFALQQNFSANAAHELRTPVAVLRTKLDIFQKKFPTVDPEVKKLIQVIGKQTDRLNAIITSLLELNNAVQPEQFEKIPLDTMLETILFNLAPNYPTIHMNKSLEPIVIKGHPQLLQQAFYNIIENGFKYNEEFGSITVSILKKEALVEISIVDTGIGISDEEKQQIFTPFYRVDDSRSRATGGSGLGLTLAKSIIEKHHGTIQLKNNSGQGTIFIVSLPLLGEKIDSL